VGTNDKLKNKKKDQDLEDIYEIEDILGLDEST